jgi:hypothetical protein
MVLRNNHPLVINARRNLNKHPARLAIPPDSGEGMVVHGHLDGRKLSRPLDPSLYVRRNAHMHILPARKRLETAKSRQAQP